MMKNVTIMLFAGTTEGRRLCEYLAEKDNSGFITHVYVTTEYGKDMILELSKNIYKEKLHIYVGRLDENDMQKELTYIKPDIVIDATHPYARVVTHNIKEVCAMAGVQYIRVLREEAVLPGEYDGDMPEKGMLVYTDTMQETVALLNSEAYLEKKILLTTGSKSISEYVNIRNYKERVYLRLLPDPRMLQSAIEAGFFPAHLIAMQGPFSTEMNTALIHQLGIEVLVTKESGNSGGYNEKLMAAGQTGTNAIVIKRPVEDEGKSLKEVMEYLKDCK